ncbi:MAG: hypothetical protein J3Q66DRAFT_439288 [Benniella sp.]|nr:MAG: hypothetical protein J3Q66DRAFT_439288 [Benniella sp.]
MILKENPELTSTSTSESPSPVLAPESTPQDPPQVLALQDPSSISIPDDTPTALTTQHSFSALKPDDTPHPSDTPTTLTTQGLSSDLTPGDISIASTTQDLSGSKSGKPLPHAPLGDTFTASTTTQDLSSVSKSGDTPQASLQVLTLQNSSASTPCDTCLPLTTQVLSFGSKTEKPLPDTPGGTLAASTMQDLSSASKSEDPLHTFDWESAQLDLGSIVATEQDLSSTHSGTLPVYNILLLGPSQSGKSSFLEHVKQYADPSYAINMTNIGSGNLSHTEVVHCEVVTTTLPIYKLFEDDGFEFNTRSIKDERSFKRFLGRDDDLKLRPVEIPGSPKVQFRIFDTPGLNDTNGKDMKNIANTFSALSEVGHLNLIIIMDSHNVPLIPSLKDAFKTYFDLFEDLKGLITVVHTHAPNKHRVPGMNARFDDKLKERSECFNQLVGRKIPTKRIDCDPEETGPPNLCMTRNAIREILEMAKVKAAVTLNATRVCKTRTMVNVDRCASDTYKTMLKENVDNLAKCQNEHQKRIIESQKLTAEAQTLIFESQDLITKIYTLERAIKKKKGEIAEYDTDELLPLFEDRFDEQVDFFGWFRDLAGRSYYEHTMDFPEQEYTIDEIDVAQQEIEVLWQSGGRGEKSWSVKFKRHRFKTGYYHVVLKMKKSTKYKVDIEKWKADLEKREAEKDRLMTDLENMKQKSAVLDAQGTILSLDLSLDTAEELKGEIEICREILDVTTAKTLPLKLFMELAAADVYKGGHPIDDAKVLGNFLRRRFENARSQPDRK